MIRYKLAEMTSRPRGTTVALAPIEDTLAARTEYLIALRAMLRELRREVARSVLPFVAAERAAQRALTQDIDRSVLERLFATARMLSGVANRLVERVLRLEARRHTRSFARSAKRALGVDLAAILRGEDLAEWFDNALIRNAALIQGLADETVKRVGLTVSEAMVAGVSQRELRSRLTKQFGFMDNRAKLIARDQVSSAVADLNRIRHQQAGITKYIWVSSRDERVRPLHQRLDGRSYRYGEATGAEGGLPPGKPIACRCVGRPVVEF